MLTMKIEESVGRMLAKKRLTLAVAESCTGGLIANRITDVSGSSRYFVMGVVTYSNEAKTRLIGVPNGLIAKHGAVSRQVALRMADAVRHLAAADIGIGVTGIAGPTGGTTDKPVGLVYIALVAAKKRVVKKFHFKGSRKSIKSQASHAALELIRRNI